MPSGINKVYVPRGKYLLGRIELTGPCKTDMRLEIKGTLTAPIDLAGDRWISFKTIDRFKIYGHGTLDGQGSLAWKKNNCSQDPNCERLPIVSISITIFMAKIFTNKLILFFQSFYK